MSESNSAPQNEKPVASNDSFNMPVTKSPWLIFALLQIPIVIFMVVMMYWLYHSQFSN